VAYNIGGTILAPGATPGSGGWNRTAYAAGFERATYQKQILVPIVEDGERLLGGMVVRKQARVQGAVLAQTSDGTGLTYLNIIGTPITVTPVGLVAPIGWSENEDAQVDANFDKEAGEGGSAALAELIEANTAANFQSATQTIANPTLDATTLRAAVQRLVGNTNGVGLPGEGMTIYGYFSSTQMVSLGSIPEVNNAMARGDSENPYVKGLWVKGFGLVANISTVAPQDANGYHNGIFLASALTVRWNTRARIKRQDFELQNRWIGYANQGSNIVHDLRLVVVRTD
jgi:hypothetical protein